MRLRRRGAKPRALGANAATLAVLWGLLAFELDSGRAAAMDLGDRAATLWSPYVEWSLDNPSISGNPFDVVASVTFTHVASGATHTTEMFYAGDTRWRFRFAGTRAGLFSFATTSDDPELDGHTGRVDVSSSADPGKTGFLVASGNKFAVQTGTAGKLEGFPFDVYMNGIDHNLRRRLLKGDPDPNPDVTAVLNEALDDTQANGFQTAFFSIMEPQLWTDGSDPLLSTFEVLEEAIRLAHARGMRLHLWMWGDAARGWDPPGGINGVVDRRLQRYLAARLAALPGWTLGYGFDLEEWTSEEQTRSWAEYLHDHMGWPHLLWARGRSNSELDVVSLSGYNVRSHASIAAGLDAEPTRPRLYEERHTYLRNGDLTMEGTRRFLWQQTIAGGAGGFWGFFEFSTHPYPNPEQLRTHREFWHDGARFLIDMQRSDELADGWALADSSLQHIVVYREAAASVTIDLSGAPGPLAVVAVDTMAAYAEIDLGTHAPGIHTLTLPHSSDWALAFGEFGRDTDADGDGMPTGWEILYGLDPGNPADAVLDLDADGVVNLDEYLNGTHPRDRDSDGVGDATDAFPDDPSESSDHDADGIGDNADTDDDADGMPDSWESIHEFDPLDASDAQEDADADGVTNFEEWLHGTDPRDRGGLLARFEFDAGAGSIAYDISGAERHAVLAAGPGSVGSAGSVSWADGSDGPHVVTSGGARVLVAADVDLALPGAFTLATWIRPTRRGTQDVLKKARYADVDGYEISLSSSGAVFARFSQVSHGNAYRLDSTSDYPTDAATWMHVACTWDGADLVLYVDGLEEARMPAPDLPLVSSALPVSLGAQDDGMRGFDGAIDDVRIYERALDAAEVADLLSAPDADSDGVADAEDAFPLDPLEWQDTDADGTGDNADPDDDNDGEPDATDAFPLDPTERFDADGDGLGDAIDPDDDNDGTPDFDDAFPNDPTEQRDSDGDLIGDAADPDDDGDGMPDDWEALWGFDPLDSADAAADADADGATNLDEFIAGTDPATSVVSDAVAIFAFDEAAGTTPVDTAAHPHPASFSGSPLWTHTSSGAAGSALRFAGDGSHVRIDDRDDLDLAGPFTLAVRIRPERRGTQDVLSKRRFASIDGYGVSLSSSGKAFARFNQATAGNAFRLDAASSYPTDGLTWMHIAVSFDAEVLRLYVDGVLEATLAAPDLVLAANLLPLAVGSQSDGSRGIEGSVDDVQLFARSLDDAEIALLAAAAVSPGEANPPDPGTDPGESGGLVVSLNLDEGSGSLAADATGLHAGSLSGAAEWTSGQRGAALRFPGDGSRLIVPDSDALDPTSATTLSVWVRPETRATQYVLKKGRYASIDGYEISLSSSGLAFARFAQRSSGNTYRVNATTSYPANGSEWMHLAVSFDGSALRLYVDGLLEGEVDASGLQWPASDVPVSIGAQDDGGRPFRGSVDDVRIWNRALSGSEIAALATPSA